MPITMTRHLLGHEITIILSPIQLSSSVAKEVGSKQRDGNRIAYALPVGRTQEISRHCWLLVGSLVISACSRSSLSLRQCWPPSEDSLVGAASFQHGFPSAQSHRSVWKIAGDVKTVTIVFVPALAAARAVWCGKTS